MVGGACHGRIDRHGDGDCARAVLAAVQEAAVVKTAAEATTSGGWSSVAAVRVKMEEACPGLLAQPLRAIAGQISHGNFLQSQPTLWSTQAPHLILLSPLGRGTGAEAYRERSEKSLVLRAVRVGGTLSWRRGQGTRA